MGQANDRWTWAGFLEVSPKGAAWGKIIQASFLAASRYGRGLTCGHQRDLATTTSFTAQRHLNMTKDNLLSATQPWLQTSPGQLTRTRQSGRRGGPESGRAAGEVFLCGEACLWDLISSPPGSQPVWATPPPREPVSVTTHLWRGVNEGK